MTAQWEVGAVVELETNYGLAILLVVESCPGSLEKATVLWGNGEFELEVGATYDWNLRIGECRRIA